MAYNKDKGRDEKFFGGDGEGGDNVIDISKQVSRLPHQQIHTSEPLVKVEFESAQYIAFLDSMHYNRRGEAVITMIVPYRFRNFAVPIVDAYGVPLSVDVQLWKPYSQRMEQTRG